MKKNGQSRKTDNIEQASQNHLKVFGSKSPKQDSQNNLNVFGSKSPKQDSQNQLVLVLINYIILQLIIACRFLYMYSITIFISCHGSVYFFSYDHFVLILGTH
jgi:preprotein translocase subunit SecF